MDDLDDLLTEHVTFGDVGRAILRAIVEMDRRAFELSPDSRLLTAWDQVLERGYEP